MLQFLPPATEAELHTIDFLSSIFIDWLSARDSNLVTVDTPRSALLLGFIPFDSGIRVAALRAGCTSELGWKKNNRATLGNDLDPRKQSWVVVNQSLHFVGAQNA